jgi:hypothetical protein
MILRKIREDTEIRVGETQIHYISKRYLTIPEVIERDLFLIGQRELLMNPALRRDSSTNEACLFLRNERREVLQGD